MQTTNTPMAFGGRFDCIVRENRPVEGWVFVAFSRSTTKTSPVDRIRVTLIILAQVVKPPVAAIARNTVKPGRQE